MNTIDCLKKNINTDEAVEVLHILFTLRGYKDTDFAFKQIDRIMEKLHA